VRQCPRRSRSRRNRHARREAKLPKSPLDIAHEPALAAEQVGNSADVEPQPVAIQFDQRRPSRSPFRKPLHQRRIACGISWNGDQPRIERPSVGQPRTRPCATFAGCIGDGMDHKPMRALDREDDRRLRR
jgi:hypothetical protein